MKVLQINTVSGKGSTGRICVDIAKTLEPYGVETVIAYGYGNPVYKNSYRIGSWIENKLHNFYSRVFGLQGTGSILATKRFISYLYKYQPDILHLNNLHGNYINYPILFQYIIQNKIPVVWTMHDCWAYTGKCAHYVNVQCEKWKTGCKNCPNVHAYPPSIFLDKSTKGYYLKKKLYSQLENVVIVGISNWIKHEAEQSILSHFKITRIYNWIDCDIFKPQGKDKSLMEKYGIDPQKFHVLGVCGRYSRLKGSESWKYLSQHLPEDCQVILVGNMEQGNEISNVVHIPYVDSPSNLSKIYSMADVFCNLSVAESFGKTTAEALACGTPIIVYNTTACPELVGEGCGYVCNLNAPQEVIEKALEIRRNGKYIYSEKCVKFAQDNFSKNNILQFLEIYRKLTKRINK